MKYIPSFLLLILAELWCSQCDVSWTHFFHGFINLSFVTDFTYNIVTHNTCPRLITNPRLQKMDHRN